MTPEERRRRQSLWYQQEINAPLRVTPLPQAPEVKVEPAQPQRFKVSVGPNVKVAPIQVSTPPQQVKPQPKRENIAKTFFKEVVKTPQRFGNIVVEGNRLAYIDLPKSIAAQVTGNKEAQANIRRDINRRLAGRGVFGGGLPEGFTSLERGSKSFIQDPTKTKTMVGTGAELGSYAIGGPTIKGVYQGLKLGAKPAIKAVTSYVAPQAVAGGLGGAGNVLAQRPNASVKEIATQGTVGAVAGPALGIGLGSSAYGVSRFLGRTNIENLAKTSNTNQIKNVITKELGENTPINIDEVATKVSKAKTPQGVAKAIDETSQLPQTRPVQPTAQPVTPLNDDVVQGVAQSNNVNEIKSVVDALLPNTDDATRTNIAISLTRVTDPTEVRRQLDEAIANEQRLSETIQEAASPRTPEQTIEQAVEESQAPIAPQALPGARQGIPEPETTTTAPEGVQGVAEPVEVPGAAPVEQAPVAPELEPTSDIIRNISETNQATKDLYKVSRGREFVNFLKRNWDPRFLPREMDSELSKKLGREINPSESLETAVKFSQRYEGLAEDYRLNHPFSGVIQKYGRGTQQEVDFNTYRIFKHDLERRLDGRKPITELSKEQLQQSVNDLEAMYPGILEDLKITSNYVRGLQEEAVNGDYAFVSKADFDKVSTKKDGSKYEFYTPIDRIMPENVQRPEINASNIGSISRDKVLQKMEKTGNDVEQTFDAIDRYTNIVFRQIGQSRVAQTLKYHADNLVGNVETKLTPEQDIAIKKAQQTIKDLNDVSKSLKLDQTKTKMRVGFAKKEMNEARRASVNRAREILRESLKPYRPNDVNEARAVDDARAAIASMSDDDLIDVLALSAEPDIKKTPNVQRIFNKLNKKSTAYGELVDRLNWSRLDAESIANAKKGVREDIAELGVDPLTGLQVVRGLTPDGGRFVVEVSPELGRLLGGIDAGKFKGAIKFGRSFTNVIRFFLTGPGNPPFLITSAIWNTIMAPLVSKRGFKIYNPKNIKTVLGTLSSKNDFQRLLNRENVIRYASDYHKISTDKTIEAIAANKDLATKMAFYAPFKPSNIKRDVAALNSAFGKVDQIYRTAAAKAEYDFVLKKTGSEREARIAAGDAYDNVLPDFGNVSTLVKLIDAYVPYVGAGVAGTRTFLRSIVQQPKKNGSIISGIGLATLGILAYNESHDAGRDFYEDMKKVGKEYELENNVFWVSPGAKKDEKTGEWTGVYRWKVPPELRPLVSSANATIFGEGVPVKAYARAVFDTITGQAFNNPRLPIAEVGSSLLSGVDTRTGQPVRDPNVDVLSIEGARQSLNYLARQLGLAGKMLNAETLQEAQKAFTDSFKRLFYGAKGSTPGNIYYQSVNESLDKNKLNSNQLNVFKGTLFPTNKDLSGEDISEKGFWNPQARAAAILEDLNTSNGALWQATKDVYLNQKAKGREIDPFYELPDDRARVVLTLMAVTDDLQKDKISKDNPWLKDFNANRSAYYDKVFGDTERKDYLGVTVPKASKDVAAKLDAMKALDPAGRAQLINENDDVQEFLNQNENYQRFKREIMGLPQLDRYPKASPEVQILLDEYNGLPKGNGPISRFTGKATSPDRSAWIKANPEKWAKITEQWYKQNIYTLQGDAGMARFEGETLDESALENIQRIADFAGGGQSGGGFARFGGGGGRAGGGAKETAGERIGISTLLGGIQPEQIKLPTIITPAQQRARFKVKLPSSSKPRRIRLQ